MPSRIPINSAKGYRKPKAEISKDYTYSVYGRQRVRQMLKILSLKTGRTYDQVLEMSVELLFGNIMDYGGAFKIENSGEYLKVLKELNELKKGLENGIESK